jgi:5,10-methenyltetrahydrofolate synthetase
MLVLDSGSVVSLYWPFRGEPDLRHWMQELIERNIRVALPVVVVRAQPMEFREWTPEAVLQPGIWNIPVPRDGELLQPTHVIAPVVGYDDAAFRLGNGGGYFDRTLAQMAYLGQKPHVIGVGPAHLHLPTIYPQTHDVPMDLVVTDTLVLRRPRIQTESAVPSGPEEPADPPVVP